MKKIVIFLFAVTLFVVMYEKRRSVTIPNNSIRIRIIADENTLESQQIKSDIKNDVNKYLNKKLYGINNYKDARKVVNANLTEIKNIVSNYTDDFNVYYGNNYFPKKEYKGVKYNEGNYESLVITLGTGNGNNWWCVLFPPLCMIDEQNLDDATYSLYVLEILKKLK